MTEIERRQHNDAMKNQILIRHQADEARRALEGLERERETLNALARVEALQREIATVLRRDERLTQAIEATRQKLAQLGGAQQEGLNNG